MSARMQLPLSQQRHSNIAVVRYQKNGVRLEIACYKNKVTSYRGGLETRMDEILQIERVFTNVGRGCYASSGDIKKALGSGYDETSAIKFILDNGDLQVAQQERTSEQDEMMKDIATVISQRCVHAITKRPFPMNIIEQALRSIGATIKLDQPVKKQALQLIHRLMDANVLPLQRAMMKLRVTLGAKEQVATVHDWCKSNGAEIVTEVVLDPLVTTPSATTRVAADAEEHVVFLIPPNMFRDADVFVKTLSGATLTVLETAVAETGEGAAADLEAVLVAGPVTDPLPVSGPSTATTTRVAKVEKPPAKPQRRKGGRHDDDDSSNDSDNASPARGSDLAAEVSRVKQLKADDDSDDDVRGKRAGKKSKKPAGKAPVAKPAPKPIVKPAEIDSDEELVSERKKKKGALKSVEAAIEDDEAWRDGLDDDEVVE